MSHNSKYSKLNNKARNLLLKISKETNIVCMPVRVDDSSFKSMLESFPPLTEELMKTVCGFTRISLMKQLLLMGKELPEEQKSKTYKFRTIKGVYRFRIKLIGKFSEFLRFSFYKDGKEVDTTLLSIMSNTHRVIADEIYKAFLKFVFVTVGPTELLGCGSFKRYDPIKSSKVRTIFIEDYPNIKKHRPYFKWL